MIRHLLQNPFITATGAAALVHSTWSLGTLFAGNEPMPQFTGAWFAWVIPAFLIAFALDVGQIATSHQIRSGNRTRATYITFAVFAVATYYLQWLYIAHHIPALALSGGVRPAWSETATLIRDAAIWVIPALLPLSTLLYTFSARSEHDKSDERTISEPTTKQSEPSPVMVEEPREDVKLLPDESADQVEAVCEYCGWSKLYDSQASAERGLRTHQTRHCTEVARNGELSKVELEELQSWINREE